MVWLVTNQFKLAVFLEDTFEELKNYSTITILPLFFTEIVKKNCFNIHTQSDHDVNNTRRKLLVQASHFVLFGTQALFIPWGLNNPQLLRDSKPIRLLEIPRPVREYVLMIHVLI